MFFIPQGYSTSLARALALIPCSQRLRTIIVNAWRFLVVCRYDNAFNRPAHGFNSAYSQHPAFSRPPQESASSIPPPCQPPPHLPISVSWQQPQSMHLPAAASSIIPPPISPMVLNQPPQPPTSASRLSSNSSTFSIGRDPRLHPSASSRH